MNREISIEDGFQIIMIFLEPFFFKIIKPKMVERGLINPEELAVEKQKTISSEEKLKDDLYDDNGFFFLVVCSGTSSDGYFEEVIEERMNIPSMKQHDGLIIKEDLLFQLTIDFCNYFNRKYQEQGKDSLRFAINWLEDMRKNPKAHKVEWDLWNQTIIKVTEHGQKSLGFF